MAKLKLGIVARRLYIWRSMGNYKNILQQKIFRIDYNLLPKLHKEIRVHQQVRGAYFIYLIAVDYIL